MKLIIESRWGYGKEQETASDRTGTLRRRSLYITGRSAAGIASGRPVRGYPASQAKGDSKLSGSYVLLLNSQESPFDEEAACQAFGRFLSQRQAGLAPLAGQTVILYIPKDDAALSAYSQSLVRRAASFQVTLAVRPLEAVFLRSRLRARLYEAILVPAASLPDGLEGQARVYEYKSYVLR